MVYAATEYQLQHQMEAQTQTLPDQKGKEARKDSLRWFFVLMRGIHCLYQSPLSPKSTARHGSGAFAFECQAS